MKRKVDVTLMGHRFAVRTEKDEAYVHDLASQVTQRIENLRRQLRTASREELALLVALNFADELEESSKRTAAAHAEVKRHTESMIGKLTEALGSSGAAPVDASMPALPSREEARVRSLGGTAMPNTTTHEDEPVLVSERAAHRRA